MKKSESLIATLSAIYACILLLCIFLYWLIKFLQLDIGLSTNLLIWSATIFAPIAVLMTYTSWREQKRSETIAEYSSEVYKKIIHYFRILENYSFTWPKHKDTAIVTKELESYFENIYPTLILYCDFLRELEKGELVRKISEFEKSHYELLQLMEVIDEEDNLEKWCEYSSQYPTYSSRTGEILRQINNALVKMIFHNS